MGESGSDLFGEGVAHRGSARQEGIGGDGWIALPRPGIPMPGKALDAGTDQSQFLGELQGHRWGLLQPLLQVVPVIGPDILPLTLGMPLRQPNGFFRPAPGGDENEGGYRTLFFAGFFGALVVVRAGLGGRVPVATDLPA